MKWWTLGFLALATLVIGAHGVDNDLTDTDRAYLPRYLGPVEPMPPTPTYADEVAYIKAVQQRVLSIAPGQDGIPGGSARGLRELFEARSGLCYDRSRVMEKLLRHAGFETRHVAVYSIVGTGSAMRSLLTPRVHSHAVSEVLTSRGWLAVDSNAAWASLDASGAPVSMTALGDALASGKAIRWAQAAPSFIYREPFVVVYGLYSRHGRFYPPYNAIPDVNFRELLHNLWP